MGSGSRRRATGASYLVRAVSCAGARDVRRGRSRLRAVRATPASRRRRRPVHRHRKRGRVRHRCPRASARRSCPRRRAVRRPRGHAAHDPRQPAGGDRSARAGSVRRVLRRHFRHPGHRRRRDRPVPRKDVRWRRVGQRGTAGRSFRGTTAANLSMMIRSSDPAPGLADLTLVNGAGNNGIQAGSRLSPDGRTFWSSYLSGPGVASSNDTAFFGGLPGSLAPIVREGDAAPAPAGAVFFGDRITSAQFTTMNRNGAVLFQSTLSGGDVVGATNNQALYTGHRRRALHRGPEGRHRPSRPRDRLDLQRPALDEQQRTGPLQPERSPGRGVTAANDASLALYTPGSGNAVLVREGQLAPGHGRRDVRQLVRHVWAAGPSGRTRSTTAAST